MAAGEICRPFCSCRATWALSQLSKQTELSLEHQDLCVALSTSPPSSLIPSSMGVIRCFCSWKGFPPQHTIHKGPFHYPVDASPVAWGDGEAASLHSCKWQLPGKGLEERKGPPWGEPFDSGVPCLTSSLVWVSFRSHGWLQHGRRPEGAC